MVSLKCMIKVQFVLAGFCCIIAFLTRTIMETPRWLYAHDKYEQARTNVRKMASWSGMEIEEKTFDEFEAEMVSFVQNP